MAEHEHETGTAGSKRAAFQHGKPTGPVILFGIVLVLGVAYIALRQKPARSSSAGGTAAGIPNTSGTGNVGPGYMYSPSPVTQYGGAGPNSAPTNPPGPLVFGPTPNPGTPVGTVDPYYGGIPSPNPDEYGGWGRDYTPPTLPKGAPLSMDYNPPDYSTNAPAGTL